jgi:hypothetical protein
MVTKNASAAAAVNNKALRISRLRTTSAPAAVMGGGRQVDTGDAKRRA